MNNPTLNRFRWCLASLILAVLVPCPTWAQNPGGGAQGGGGFGNVQPPAASLTFSGGHLGEMIELMRTEWGPDLNMVVNGPVDEVKIPAMKLKNVYPQDVIQTLEKLTNHGTHQVTVDLIPGVQGYISVVSVRAPPTRQTRPSAEEPTKVMVFSIGDLVTDIQDPKKESGNIEDLLSAIEFATELRSNKTQPKMKLHVETGLLLVAGTQEDADLIENLLSELRLSRESRQRHQRVSDEIQRLRGELLKTQMELEEARNRASVNRNGEDARKRPPTE